jgi:HK97 gp10 family phage protein
MDQSARVGEGALALMAAGDFHFRLNGADQLINRLSKLPDKLQDKAGRVSARKAMAIVREDARRRLKAIDDPGTPESIPKNVFIQQSRRGSKTIGGVMMRVGILGGARTGFRKTDRAAAAKAKTYPGGDTRYWRFVELGTEKISARPFLRPALEQNAEKVVSTLTTGLSVEIDQLAAER